MEPKNKVRRAKRKSVQGVNKIKPITEEQLRRLCAEAGFILKTSKQSAAPVKKNTYTGPNIFYPEGSTKGIKLTD